MGRIHSAILLLIVAVTTLLTPPALADVVSCENQLGGVASSQKTFQLHLLDLFEHQSGLLNFPSGYMEHYRHVLSSRKQLKRTGHMTKRMVELLTFALPQMQLSTGDQFALREFFGSRFVQNTLSHDIAGKSKSDPGLETKLTISLMSFLIRYQNNPYPYPSIIKLLTKADGRTTVLVDGRYISLSALLNTRALPKPRREKTLSVEEITPALQKAAPLKVHELVD